MPDIENTGRQPQEDQIRRYFMGASDSHLKFFDALTGLKACICCKHVDNKTISLSLVTKQIKLLWQCFYTLHLQYVSKLTVAGSIVL